MKPTKEELAEAEKDLMAAEMAYLKAKSRIELLRVTSIDYIIEDAEEDAEEKKPSCVRMARKRKRESNAFLFWVLRLKTGHINFALIEDALLHAPDIVTKARDKAVKKLSAYADKHPERVEMVKNTEVEG